MKLGALLLALAFLLALPDTLAWLRRRRVPRGEAVAPRSIEARFRRVETTKPLDPGHYYKRYWS
jgi:hypothetical protein